MIESFSNYYKEFVDNTDPSIDAARTEIDLANSYIADIKNTILNFVPYKNNELIKSYHAILTSFTISDDMINLISYLIQIKYEACDQLLVDTYKKYKQYTAVSEYFKKLEIEAEVCTNSLFPSLITPFKQTANFCLRQLYEYDSCRELETSKYHGILVKYLTVSLIIKECNDIITAYEPKPSLLSKLLALFNFRKK
jgi:hypothetical protein